ncbi:MAG: ROK family transcriptional regulator [Verrucomicrobia bacterium]|nr:ROK family transcriptional regulator [Verrucomicrobiota bacterium]MBV9299510.1 ROK family transcriptional regulator [Verrucomicrobiota bacterium]MBV9644129.1 ROK family transcriptional regulator [Verrucomicrobiota bacterium]
MSTRGPAIIRNINRFDVLHTIRLHDNQISRSELSDLTGLSQATISSIVGHLIDEGALVEDDASGLGARGRGRPLVMLRLNPEYTHVVGVKIATHQIVFSVTDFVGNVCASDNIPVEPLKLTPAQLLAFIVRGVRVCLKKAGKSIGDVSGIGVGLPGFVDSHRGMAFWSPVFASSNVNFRELLQTKFDVPVFVENDANLVTLAELWFGMAKGLENAVVVTIEHGTGSGLIFNGRLYRGAQGLAAEFGHTKLVFNGPPCQCGERGCMETRTAAFAIIHEAAKAGFRIPKRPLDYNERSRLVQEIVARAEAGDKAMKRIFEQMGRYLGLGIANLVNLLNPERVIICQGAIRCAHLFEDSLRLIAEQMVIPPLKRNLEIVIHHWGDEVWARGAASLVLLELDQKGRSELPRGSSVYRRRAARNGKTRPGVNDVST